MLDRSYAGSDRVGFLDATFSPRMRVETHYYGADERVEIVGSPGWIRVARCSARLYRAAERLDLSAAAGLFPVEPARPPEVPPPVARELQTLIDRLEPR